MSKEMFASKISNAIAKKICYLENYNYVEFMKNDEYFNLALCLGYLVLTKEKIIKKDMNNTDRLGRLTKKVDQSEIDKVFDDNFVNGNPLNKINITSSQESSNLWVLDAIRDSIMHCMLEIDDTAGIFELQNTYHDRTLVGQVPYEWIVAYAQNDIFHKRIMDRYTIKGFYYNNKLKKNRYFNTINEINHNIMYNVTVYGNQFNVKLIENRIKELFEEYAKKDITFDEVKSYRNRMYKNRQYFDEEYLASFIRARDEISRIISQEFPGVTTRIYIDNRKHKLINKVGKGFMKSYRNYNVLYKSLNESVSQKGIMRIEQISSIIAGLGTTDEMVQLPPEENHKKFNGLLNQYDETDPWSVRETRNKNIRSLREILLNLLGIATLVINHDDAFTKFYENATPNDVGLIVVTKERTEAFYKEYIRIYKELLLLETRYDTQLNNYNKMPDNSTRKQQVETMVNDLANEIELKKKELKELKITLSYRPFELTKTEQERMEDTFKQEQHELEMKNLYKAFKAQDPKLRKAETKALIEKLNEIKEYEMRNRYGYVTDPKEWLLVLRNCFSHVGRISIKENLGLESQVTLTDFDNNNERTGIVFCKYAAILDVLFKPTYHLLNPVVEEEIEETKNEEDVKTLTKNI